MSDTQHHSIEQSIQCIEEKWITHLNNFVKEKFSGVWLPSHDHSHHMRVWLFAKQILKEIALKRQFEPDLQFIESLIFCCFFHDVGLTVTLDERHGIESGRIFQSFYNSCKNCVNLNTNSIIRCIELHDDKNYTGKTEISDKLLHNILTVSDDLDAFGAVGVVRYLEIYWLRGNDIKDIPRKVLRNAQSRYDNFVRIFKDCSGLISYHIERYRYLTNFYSKLRKEDELNRKDNSTPYTKIVNGYIHLNIHKTRYLADLNYDTKDDSLGFYKQFRKELKFNS